MSVRTAFSVLWYNKLWVLGTAGIFNYFIVINFAACGE
jgi:hypothetical protein